MSKKIIKGPTTVLYHTYVADMAGCGYIRCMFPSMLVSQYIHKQKIRFMPSYNMYFINDPSFYKNQMFVTFQRSATPEQLKLIQYFETNFKKQTNTPLLYEIDDLLTDIPDWNYASDYYKQYSSVAIEIMKHMDGMIVSTNKLKEVYSDYCPKIRVSPNHLIKGFWGEAKYVEQRNQKPRILWAGSGNHFATKKGQKGGDFGTKLMDFILKTKDDYQWVIVGGCPTELEKEKKIEKHGWIPLLNYPNYMKSLKIDLAIAPLEQNLFNECKSNIKALEYTASGVPAIYTNIEPYKDMTVVCDTEEWMIHQIGLHLSNPSKLKTLWYSDYKKIKSQLFWEDNNNLTKYLNKMFGIFNTKLF